MHTLNVIKSKNYHNNYTIIYYESQTTNVHQHAHMHAHTHTHTHMHIIVIDMIYNGSLYIKQMKGSINTKMEYTHSLLTH